MPGLPILPAVQQEPLPLLPGDRGGKGCLWPEGRIYLWRIPGMEKKQAIMSKRPLIDRYHCRDCEACLNICPKVFKKNDETGCIEVADLSEYPEEEIQEAISLCPDDCISWAEP